MPELGHPKQEKKMKMDSQKAKKNNKKQIHIGQELRGKASGVQKVAQARKVGVWKVCGGKGQSDAET